MFSRPKIPEPRPVPQAPTKADASVVTAGQREMQRYASLLSRSGRGTAGGELKRKAHTEKPSLIG